LRAVIVGAGAIGAYLGARMAHVGQDVTLVARGPHLRAMQERGIRVHTADEQFEATPVVTDRLESIGPTDVVFLGVKAHSLPEVAPRLSPLFGPDTAVVSMQNGVPWWFFQGYGGEFDGLRLERVDPGGVVAAAIEPRRVIGSIVYVSSEIVEPGVVRHHEGARITLGEPDGSRSDRARRLAETLGQAGFRCPVTTRIRPEIWVKILGNAAFNPISALTGATLGELARHPDVAALIREIMAESAAVGERLGLKLPVSIEQRLAGAEKVGEHRTSMLQDLEAGRPLELDAIVGAVLELGERLGLPLPATRTVYACTKLRAALRARSGARPPR
jgi:2-dehydropantoate 2-reductase